MFPHVLHQVRLLQREERRERGGDSVCKTRSPTGRNTTAQGAAPVRSGGATPWEACPLLLPPSAANTHRGVGPAADGAGVDLGVFHRVRSQVYLQGGSIRVRTVAVVALERFVFVVLPSVGLGGSSGVEEKESK